MAYTFSSLTAHFLKSVSFERSKGNKDFRYGGIRPILLARRDHHAVHIPTVSESRKSIMVFLFVAVDVELYVCIVPPTRVPFGGRKIDDVIYFVSDIQPVAPFECAHRHGISVRFVLHRF